MNEVLRMAVLRAKIARQLPASDKLVADNAELRQQIEQLRAANQELKDKVLYLEKVKKYRVPEERRSKHFDFKQILQLVAAKSEFTEIALLGAGRNKHIVRWRHVLMYLAHRLTGYSLPQIGRLLGNRDHTTILHGVQKLTAQRLVDAQLDQLLSDCERELRHGVSSQAASSGPALVSPPSAPPTSAGPPLLVSA